MDAIWTELAHAFLNTLPILVPLLAYMIATRNKAERNAVDSGAVDVGVKALLLQQAGHSDENRAAIVKLQDAYIELLKANHLKDLAIADLQVQKDQALEILKRLEPKVEITVANSTLGNQQATKIQHTLDKAANPNDTTKADADHAANVKADAAAAGSTPADAADTVGTVTLTGPGLAVVDDAHQVTP